MVDVGDTLSRYELLAVLGRGSFATVYRARDTVLGREVALKVPFEHVAADPDERARFLAEGRALAALRHSNIVTLFDVGEAAGRPYLAMDLIDGETLATWMQRRGAVSLAEALPILTDIAAAIDHLHGVGIVHRDLKPANVLLSQSGRAVLSDFGIARALDQTLHTKTGMSLGTPEYMAPEQVKGEAVGPAADIYAFGVLAFHLLSGGPPFTGQTAHVLYVQAHEPPPDLNMRGLNLPGTVCEAVGTTLKKQPAERPGSAQEFVSRLAVAAMPTPQSTPPALSGQIAAELSQASSFAELPPTRRVALAESHVEQRQGDGNRTQANWLDAASTNGESLANVRVNRSLVSPKPRRSRAVVLVVVAAVVVIGATSLGLVLLRGTTTKSPARSVAVAAPSTHSGTTQAAQPSAPTPPAAAMNSPAAVAASANTVTAQQVLDTLKNAGLPIGASQAYTAETDPNHLLGRLGQYVDKLNFLDTRLGADASSFDTGHGGSVEVFANADDAQQRKTYIESLGKLSPLLTEYDYENDGVLLRLSQRLTPDQAAAYQAILQRFAQPVGKPVALPSTATPVRERILTGALSGWMTYTPPDQSFQLAIPPLFIKDG